MVNEVAPVAAGANIGTSAPETADGAAPSGLLQPAAAPAAALSSDAGRERGEAERLQPPTAALPLPADPGPEPEAGPGALNITPVPS